MTTSLDPLVGIFTPVYNGEKYIETCMESIVGQTYRNWIYVVVNNCSTDRTKEIAEAYATRDQRIRVHDNETFLTAMQNHNVGFRLISTGCKYCKVVHADDWLFPDCLARMVSVAEEHPSVGVVGAYSLQGDRVILDGLPYPSTIVPGLEIGRWYLTDGMYVFGNPTAVLYRSDLVRTRQPFYRERYPLWADLDACLDILRESDFGFVHQVLTFTRRHEGALSAFARRVNSYVLGQLELLEKYGPVYLDPAVHRMRRGEMLREYRRFLGRSLFSRPRDREFWAYHMAGLRDLGHPMKWPALVGAALAAVVEVLGDPFRRAWKVLVGSRDTRAQDSSIGRSSSTQA